MYIYEEWDSLCGSLQSLDWNGTVDWNGGITNSASRRSKGHNNAWR